MPSPRSRRSLDDEFDTESLTSTDSTLDYPFFWDRRYHKFREGSYLYPNDEHEKDRQDCEFEILQRFLFDKKLFFAPLENPRNILDIGTGTGIWAVEMAEQFPEARIKGWDLSFIQPVNAPSNVTWEIFDCTDDIWLRHPSSMDYIHVSMMFGAVSRYDELICKAKEYLVPGTGWLECRELLPEVFCDDDTIPDHWAFGDWLRKFRVSSSQRVQPPRPVMVADKLKHWMEAAGYVDVHEFVKTIPINPWPEKAKLRVMGEMWMKNLENALQGWSFKTLGPDGWGMSRNELEVVLAGARADLQNSEIHGYQKVYCVYGRRPTNAEVKGLRERGQQGAQMTNSVHHAPGATFPASRHGSAPPAAQSRPSQPRPPRNSPATNGTSRGPVHTSTAT